MTLEMLDPAILAGKFKLQPNKPGTVISKETSADHVHSTAFRKPRAVRHSTWQDEGLYPTQTALELVMTVKIYSGQPGFESTLKPPASNHPTSSKQVIPLPNLEIPINSHRAT